MSINIEQLYQLLPAIYRIRDAEQGELLNRLPSTSDAESEGPLKQLLSVLAEQIGLVESDIAQLYDNWFIETCEEWVVPYRGELLHVRGLHPIPNKQFSLRSQVANTLAYRRRKGTATMLEQLARDTTLWNARVVEFFELLATTQYVNHIRPHNLSTPDLRQRNSLDLLDTAFDTIAHTADVRSIARNRGRHNIPNVGIFLWRLESYPLEKATPMEISEGCYTVTSCGYDAPLFNRPETEETITHLAEEINVPDAIRPVAFYQDLKSYRDRDGALPVTERSPKSQYYGNDTSINLIRNDNPIPPLDIVCKNLSTWDRPPAGKVAIDVRLGRIAFPTGEAPENLQVSYHYGSSGDIGGGPYDRRRINTPSASPDIIANSEALDDLIQIPSSGFNTITEAITRVQEIWAIDPSRRIVVQINDNRTYTEDLTLNLVGAELVLQAANNKRPTLIGNITVVGSNSKTSLTINGLLIAGHLSVTEKLAQLNIIHSTLLPGVKLDLAGVPESPETPSLSVPSSIDTLQIEINQSIVGSLRLHGQLKHLAIRDSIIDFPRRTAPLRPAISADESGESPAPPTLIERATVFGSVHVQELTASEVIFTRPVRVVRRQTGCVRFSYVPPSSNPPRRFRCQPELEIATQIQQEEKTSGKLLSLEERNAIRDEVHRWLIPAFTTTQYGQPAYAQLSLKCPVQIRVGAEDGSEIGVFSFLKQPQREANLRSNLDEYLRFGLNAGLIFVT